MTHFHSSGFVCDFTYLECHCLQLLEILHFFEWFCFPRMFEAFAIIFMAVQVTGYDWRERRNDIKQRSQKAPISGNYNYEVSVSDSWAIMQDTALHLKYTLNDE